MVTPDAQSQRDALDKRMAALRRRIETAAQKTQNVGALMDAARLAAEARTDLEKLGTSFGPLSLRDRGVQAALEDGARQFFAGEYQQALATLDSDSQTDAPLQLQVHLFRAAAAYQLFLRSGEQDEALQARARAEVDACKQLNSQFTPDSRAFTPHFLAFYANATPVAGSIIGKASIGERIYRQMRLSYASDTSRALRLDQSIGVGADRVLRRKSGLKLSQPVPSIYTRPVFQRNHQPGDK